MHVKILQKNSFVEKVWPANLALFVSMWPPITLKQLNNLNAIDTFCWIGGKEESLQTAVPEVPGSITGSGKEF